MIVRALDTNGDWTFGQGRNNYLSQNQAIAQDIQTRLLSFLGDCFFDVNAGINWFYYLGGKDQISLNLAISSVILNTANVTGILQLSVNLNHQNRKFSSSYNVTTTYSTLVGTFQYDVGGIE